MTTYKKITKNEIIELISRLQDPSHKDLMHTILTRNFGKLKNDSIKLLNEFRKRTNLDILHTTGDLFLIRYNTN